MPHFKYPRAALEIETSLRRARDIADPATPYQLRTDLWNSRKELSDREQHLIETYVTMYLNAREMPPYSEDRHVPMNEDVARALIEVHILAHR